MNALRTLLPVFIPFDEDKAAGLSRVLRIVSYLGVFSAIGFLIALYAISFDLDQSRLVTTHRAIWALVLALCVVTLYLIRRGRVRLGGALQVVSLWLSLTILPDLLGIPLHVIAASHVALAICIGPLAGWPGTLALGIASFAYILVQDSPYAMGWGAWPLLELAAWQIFVVEVALYIILLSMTALIVFVSQRRSEYNRVTAEALEVASYSEKKLETIIESMADVLLVVDVHGNIVKANHAAFTLLGYTEAELSGKPLRLLLLDIPDDSSGVETMAGRRAMRHVSRRLRAKDGRVLLVSLSSAMMTDGAGQPDGVILVAQDITELETMRMQLHMSNVRFNQAIAFSRIGVFEFDMDRGEFAIEDTLREALKGAGMDTIRDYDQFLDRVVPEDRDVVAAALGDYRAGRKSHVDVEFRINTQRGVRWIMVRGAQQEESGPHLIGTFMDVTRRKRAELDLARRDDMLRAVTASSEAFLRASDWEAQIPALLSSLGSAAGVSRVYAFRTFTDEFDRGLWTQLHVWAAPGIAGADETAVHDFDYVEAGFQDWADRLAARMPVFGSVGALDERQRAFYERRQIKSTAIVPIFVQDEWWGLIGFEDVAADRVWNESEIDALQLAADSLGAAIYRQRVERDLSGNRDFLMSIMQNLGQGVMVVDGSGHLLFANPAYASMTGIPADKLIGHKPEEFVDPEFADELRRQRAQRAQGRAGSYTSRIIHASGSATDVLVTSVPRFVDGRPDGAYAVLTDMSERRRIEENRMQLALEREQMRIMANFVRDASHDFRTPLSIIQTSLYLLRRKAESPEQLERLTTVGAQASRLSRLIDGLLTMLELDKAELALIPINLKTVGQNAVERVREQAHKVGLSIDLVMPDEPCFVNGEEGYLMKAVANLIDNAVAFTPTGGRIRMTIRADDENVRLDVADTGIGIAADEHERIFERLYKVDKARTIDSGGLGMGLSITRRIMELHGGTVSVSSSLGEGSIFTLTFNRARQAPSRPRTAASPIAEDVTT